MGAGPLAITGPVAIFNALKTSLETHAFENVKRNIGINYEPLPEGNDKTGRATDYIIVEAGRMVSCVCAVVQLLNSFESYTNVR